MKKLLALILVLALLLVPVSAYAVPLDEVYSLIEYFYVEEVDSAQLRATDPQELGRFLGDPYTSYFTPEDFFEFLSGLQGTYGGIGTVITQIGGETIIQSVFAGSPAEKAGLKAGDVIVSVHGVTIDWLSLDIVSWLIRGAAGTEVELGIRRNGKNFTVTIVRDTIELPTVEAQQMGDIAYIAIGSFSEKTPATFKKKLQELRAGNPRGYILDLRGNPGGSLKAVLEIAEDLLPAGPVVYLRDRLGNEDVFRNERGSAPLPNLYVLVDSGSASGAEILAGALQDYNRGIVVGSRTYGKASVQTLFELTDGSGLKLTTALYYTPNNQAINNVGLTPDVAVDHYHELNYAVERIRSVNPTLVFTIGRTLAWSTGSGEFNLDGLPFIYEARSYIPLRILAETMGAEVTWDADAWAATIRKGAVQLEVPVGSTTALRNGQSFEMLGESKLVNGRIYVPARAVAEALGGRVWWDAHRLEVIIDW